MISDKRADVALCCSASVFHWAVRSSTRLLRWRVSRVTSAVSQPTALNTRRRVELFQTTIQPGSGVPRSKANWSIIITTMETPEITSADPFPAPHPAKATASMKNNVKFSGLGVRYSVIPVAKTRQRPIAVIVRGGSPFSLPMRFPILAFIRTKASRNSGKNEAQTERPGWSPPGLPETQTALTLSS